jgi:hypothetical protein
MAVPVASAAPGVQVCAHEVANQKPNCPHVLGTCKVVVQLQLMPGGTADVVQVLGTHDSIPDV